MVGAPLDTTRADRGGAAAPVDRGGVLRRFLGSAGKPKSVTDTAADPSRADGFAQTATFSTDADGQAWTPPTWEEIVSTHSGRVYRLAYRLTGNQHDAEDLTQEVFVRVFRSLSTYTPGTFEGWLHRITTNLFLDMVRRKQRIRFDALG
ncbi:sigma-70 family RNA polymerase sigma factor, partial [Streptomyces carpinensis]|uniref:sigma-70 family RNA polymerase sigma factor n=1 Tax=Streptomyces carpinensis TaxID=66369 RepID=UPI001ABFB1A6